MAKWLDDAVFYEIYPQSFQDNNGDGIGDFQGIIKRLDYIQNLGCNAIWMNPCFESPFYDAGYDVTDFYKAAPRYGTNEDLRTLFQEVHKRGMHILLDLVAGHTSVLCKWFTESCRPEKNEYSDRYVWTHKIWEGDNSTPGINGWLRGISDREGAVAVNCFSTQPALNYGFGEVTEEWQFAADSPQAEEGRELLQDIMSFWMDMGCDGFRVDMAASLVKADPDKYWTKLLWQKIRKFLDEKYPEAVLISEWGNPKEALEAGFHMDFLLHNGPTHYMDLFRTEPYFSKKGTGDISEFVKIYMETHEKMQGRGFSCIPSGNHDMKRMRHTLDEEEMKLAFAFLLTMPGCPYIYYGDEIGMRYIEDMVSKEGGYDRTGSRTPMQWDGTTNAGFSSAPKEELYLPLDMAENRPTVEAQLAKPDSLLNMVKELIALRHTCSALQSRGDIRFLYAEKKEYPFVYERISPGQRVTVILNPADWNAFCALEEAPGEVMMSCHGTAQWEKGVLTVPPCSFTICRK
ncbi:MAG: alpha-amylase family glycosyl hydrolase [Eubacteriales bacterium]|nr:alpha-amylase family glycosyl hydrolase [Eubacteriales bacterium]